MASIFRFGFSVVIVALLLGFMIACDTLLSADDNDDPITDDPTPKVIDIRAIAGVTAPSAGEIPVAAITETDQYTGTVIWSPDDDEFAYQTEYTAAITLTAKEGYTLEGVTANYFTVAGAHTVTYEADSGVVEAVFPATGDTPPETIDIAAIPGVTAPVAGETPVTSIEATDQYTGTVVWKPSHSTFEYETEYTATITLIAKEGYTLQGVDKDFFEVQGAESVCNDVDSGVVEAVFPATGDAPPETIDIAEISGVTVPVAGETPVTETTETLQYTGTVSWEPSHSTFEYETEYTATIILTAKDGYTLEGVVQDFFTVQGAESVSNDADSGEVTAEFPVTEDTPETIDIAAIPGVTAPVAGETPVTSIEATNQYTGTVIWEPSHSTFEYETEYTATIILIAKNGYTLEGVAEDFFAVEGAESVSNDADSGEVTAEFSPVPYVIGSIGPAGGIIFYIDVEHDHDWTYLETWTEDEVGSYRWGPQQDMPTNSGIGYGEENTTAMVNNEQNYPAADAAWEAVHGGFDDWFLPSKDELNAIWDNIVDDGAGSNSEVGDFASDHYWSSSESGTFVAWAQHFGDGTQDRFRNKVTSTRVRVVRAF